MTTESIIIFKPNDKRAKYAIIGIWIVFTIEIISMLSNYLQYDLIDSVMNGLSISQLVADNNDKRQQIINLISLLFIIVSGVAFIYWFRRAYYNLGLIANTMHTDNWAIWAWVTPIISLFRPYQIMKELYEKTDNYLIDEKGISVEKTKLPFIGVWWFFWLAARTTESVLSKIYSKSDTIEQIMFSTKMFIVFNFVELIHCIIAIKIIADYSKKESILFETNLFSIPFTS
ncbi:MAG: DUF4328 domain-containing protein [Bacteroidota bacterium]